MLIATVVLCGVAFVGGPTATGAQKASTSVGLVINENGNSIIAIDPETRTVIGMLDTGGVLNRPHLAYYDPEKRHLFVANKAGNFSVYHLAKPFEPKLLANVKPGGDGEMHWVVMAGGLVWVAHEGDSTLYGYDPKDLSAPAVKFDKAQGLNSTHGAAVRPGTNEIWITNRPANAPGTVIRIDAKSRAIIGQPLQTTGTAGDRPNNVAFTPDGRWAYAANTGNNATQVTLIDAQSFAVVKQIEQDPKQGLSPHALIYHPATKRFFIANQNGNTVSVLDTTTNTIVGYIPIGIEPHGVSIAPDGTIYASARRGNEISVIDPNSLAVVDKIMTPAVVGPHQIIFIDRLPGPPNTGAGGSLLPFDPRHAGLSAVAATLPLALLLVTLRLRQRGKEQAVSHPA
jgi:YVTN family beta-propeller protein